MSLAKAKGVDTSVNNGNINLEKVKKAGYKFVMIRCGFGSDIKSQDDGQIEATVKKAEKLGMPWGVYLYSYATSVKEAKSEVEHVKRLLKGKKPTLPIAFDMEDADGYKAKRKALKKSLITDICKTFLSEIKKAGYYPMLYTSFSWLGYYIDKSVYSKYDLWVAQWAAKCSYKGSNLGIWQYGGETCVIESNSIPGVGVIDKDKCLKDYPTIIKKGGYNNWKKTTTPSKPTNSSTTTKTVAAPKLTYKIRSGGKWSKELKGPEKFTGSAITDIAMKVSRGSIWYQVHVKGGKWLPKITKYDIKDKEKGCAGNGKEIDAIRGCYTPTATDKKAGRNYHFKYRVKAKGYDGFFSYQIDDQKTKGQDGYAGIIGKAIVGFLGSIEK